MLSYLFSLLSPLTPNLSWLPTSHYRKVFAHRDLPDCWGFFFLICYYINKQLNWIEVKWTELNPSYYLPHIHTSQYIFTWTPERSLMRADWVIFRVLLWSWWSFTALVPSSWSRRCLLEHWKSNVQKWVIKFLFYIKLKRSSTSTDTENKEWIMVCSKKIFLQWALIWKLVHIFIFINQFSLHHSQLVLNSSVFSRMLLKLSCNKER